MTLLSRVEALTGPEEVSLEVALHATALEAAKQAAFRVWATSSRKDAPLDVLVETAITAYLEIIAPYDAGRKLNP